ncbi:MAG: radical SAM protein [Bacillota bacterium]|nr:radical SAM protein [Bacillota bacterium]
MICGECPRKCGAVRDREYGNGVCGVGELPKVVKVMLHKWEEPCISGEKGSGAVFFSGCSLKCVFCQNYEISVESKGKYITISHLRKLFEQLIDEGAHNINLVNPTHYVHAIKKVLEEKLPVPVVYNCGGYESIDALREMNGKVQIYLADYKYSDNNMAKKYSGAGDYPEVAAEAIKEMYRQTGDFELDSSGMMTRGVIIRHLVLPGAAENSKKVIDFVAREFKGKKVMFSLMGQYLPFGKVLSDNRYAEINKKVAAPMYRKLCQYMEACQIEYGYTQQLSAADSKYKPDFECNI